MAEQSWRASSQAELDVLDKLFSVDFFGRDEARAQVEGCLVRANCLCGCPSIEIKVSSRQTLIPAPQGEAREYGFLEKLDVEGSSPGCLILLFARDGYLAELEFAPFAEGPYEIPPVEDIEVFLDAPNDWQKGDLNSATVD